MAKVIMEDCNVIGAKVGVNAGYGWEVDIKKSNFELCQTAVKASKKSVKSDTSEKPEKQDTLLESTASGVLAGTILKTLGVN